MVITVVSTIWVSAARTPTAATGNQVGRLSSGSSPSTTAVTTPRTDSGQAPLSTTGHSGAADTSQVSSTRANSAPLLPVGVPAVSTSDRETTRLTGATETKADGGDTTSTDPTSREATATTTQPPATIRVPSGRLFAFGTPSGNIRCQTADGILTCVIVSFDYAAPPGTCAGEVSEFSPGQILQLAKEPGFGCHAPPRSADQIVLPYGHAIQNERYRCRSEVSGVTCTDRRSGIGLQISRGAYHWLG